MRTYLPKEVRTFSRTTRRGPVAIERDRLPTGGGWHLTSFHFGKNFSSGFLPRVRVVPIGRNILWIQRYLQEIVGPPQEISMKPHHGSSHHVQAGWWQLFAKPQINLIFRLHFALLRRVWRRHTFTPITSEDTNDSPDTRTDTNTHAKVVWWKHCSGCWLR